MQAASANGFALSGMSSEVPQVAGGLAAASAVVGAVGVGVQAAAGWELYMQTGNIAPFENSSIGDAINLTLDGLGVPQPANGMTNMAAGNILGGAQATCPAQ